MTKPDVLRVLQEHFEDPYHRGECERPTHVGAAELAGCQVAYSLRVDGVRILEQVWFDGQGCETCEAVASMLAEYCEGRFAEELQSMTSSQFVIALGLDPKEVRLGACLALPLKALQQTLLNSPHASDEYASDNTNFGGPSLGEEC